MNERRERRLTRIDSNPILDDHFATLEVMKIVLIGLLDLEGGEV